MFKLQFFRTAAPGPSPSWDSALQDSEDRGTAKDSDPFGHVSSASEAQRQTWAAVWRWHRGAARVISDCHFAVHPNHFISDLLSYSVAVFPK
jgi:hypothetical protein